MLVSTGNLSTMRFRMLRPILADTTPVNKRLLFYLALCVISLAAALSVTYWLSVFVLGSKTLAVYVLGFSVVLIAPTFFISFYWSYRLDFRASTITPEESKTVFRSSWLLAIAALPLFWGTLLFKNGWQVTGAVALAIYLSLAALHVRLLWQSRRRTYERLIAEGGLGTATSPLTQAQGRNLSAIIMITIVIAGFVWSGVYLIVQGSFFLGALATTIGALLCSPLMRKIRQTLVRK